jgi:hypothetical protein
MPVAPHADPPPRRRIGADCARRGRAAVVADCVRLLHGQEVDPGVILTLGGPTARALLARGVRPDQEYWLRVWAVRGLLWVGPDGGLAGLRVALADPAWRVREMAAKVVARHVVGDLLDQVVALRADPVARVRVAADRAVRAVVEAGA